MPTPPVRPQFARLPSGQPLSRPVENVLDMSQYNTGQIGTVRQAEANRRKAKQMYRDAYGTYTRSINPDSIIRMKREMQGWGDPEEHMFRQVFRELADDPEVQDAREQQRKIDWHQNTVVEGRLPGFRELGHGLVHATEGIGSLAARVLGDSGTADRINRQHDIESAALDQARGNTALPDWFEKGLHGTSRSLVLRTLLSPLGPYGIIGAFAATEANQAITEAADGGLTGWDKWSYVGKAGLVEGGVAGVFQLVGAGGLESYLGGARTLTRAGIGAALKQTGMVLLQELPEEVITEMLHTYNRIAAGLDDSTFNERKGEVFKDTVIQTIMAVGASTSIGSFYAQKSLKQQNVIADRYAEQFGITPKAAMKALQGAISSNDFAGALGVGLWTGQLTDEGGAKPWAEMHEEQAKELAETPKPTPVDFERAGLPPMNRRERRRFVRELRALRADDGPDGSADLTQTDTMPAPKDEGGRQDLPDIPLPPMPDAEDSDLDVSDEQRESTRDAMSGGAEAFVAEQEQEARAQAEAAARLPRALAGAKPRFNYGKAGNILDFESDVDKALFITSQTKKSRRDAAYRAWLRGQGLDDAEIDSRGQEVRVRVKDLAKAASMAGHRKGTKRLSVPRSEDQATAPTEEAGGTPFDAEPDVEPYVPTEREREAEIAELDAQDEIAVEPEPEADTEADIILTSKGRPFRTKGAATAAANRHGVDPAGVVKIEGGYAVRRGEAPAEVEAAPAKPAKPAEAEETAPTAAEEAPATKPAPEPETQAQAEKPAPAATERKESETKKKPESTTRRLSKKQREQQAKIDKPRKMDATGKPEDGGPIEAGDVFLTSSGRKTTPFPKYFKNAKRNETRTNQWLILNATAEAESRNDDFNAPTFKASDARGLPQASKDAMTEYLFGEQPAVPAPILKPLVEEAPKKATEDATPPAEPQSWLATLSPEKQAEAAALQKSLNEKLNRTSSGVDPTILGEGVKLTALYAEAGMRRFADFAHEMLTTFGEKGKAYMVAWWQGAADVSGIDGMDDVTRKQARATIARIEAQIEADTETFAPLPEDMADADEATATAIQDEYNALKARDDRTAAQSARMQELLAWGKRLNAAKTEQAAQDERSAEEAEPWMMTRAEFEAYRPPAYEGDSAGTEGLSARDMLDAAGLAKYRLSARTESDARGEGTRFPYTGPIGETVTLYRAVPSGGKAIYPGVYATLSRPYAADHLQAHKDGRYVENQALIDGGVVVSRTVPSSEVVVLANNELAWVPPDPYRGMVESAIADGKPVPQEIRNAVSEQAATPESALPAIVPNSPDLKIANMEAMPAGRGLRYLETLRGEQGELIAKQWRRRVTKAMQDKAGPSTVFVDFKPEGGTAATAPTGDTEALILTTKGRPFRTRGAATAAANRHSVDPAGVVEIEGGYGVRRREKASTAAEEVPAPKSDLDAISERIEETTPGVEHTEKVGKTLSTKAEVKAAQTVLLGEIDAAIAKAPALADAGEDDELSTVTFNVPDDGTFKTTNTKESLETFRAAVKKQFKTPKARVKSRSALDKPYTPRPADERQEPVAAAEETVAEEVAEPNKRLPKRLAKETRGILLALDFGGDRTHLVVLNMGDDATVENIGKQASGVAKMADAQVEEALRAEMTRLEDVPDNESTKRMMEVALAGDMNVALVYDPDGGVGGRSEAYAMAMADIGNSMAKQSGSEASFSAQPVTTPMSATQIAAEVFPPAIADFRGKPETGEEMQARATASRTNTVPTADMSRGLLGKLHGAAALDLTEDIADAAAATAVSIARLDGSDTVSASHYAEAVQMHALREQAKGRWQEAETGAAAEQAEVGDTVVVDTAGQADMRMAVLKVEPDGRLWVDTGFTQRFVDPGEVKSVIPGRRKKRAAEKVRKDAALAAEQETAPPPKPKKTRKKRAVKAKDEATEDVGEELVYNRRNRITGGIVWADIQDKTAALKVRAVTKRKVAPPPDYQGMVDDGVNPLIVHAVKQAYDKISTKPTVRGAPNDEQLQQYMAGALRVRDALVQWANSDDARRWLAASAERIGKLSSGGAVSLSVFTKDSDEGLRPVDTVYPGGWQANEAEMRILGGTKFYRSLSPGTDELVKATKDIGIGWPGKTEAWQRQGYSTVLADDLTFVPHEFPAGRFGAAHVVVNVGVPSGGRKTDRVMRLDVDGATSANDQSVKDAIQTATEQVKGKVLLLDKRGSMIGAYETTEEAKAAARDATKRKPKDQIGPKGQSVESAYRIGAPRRAAGENIDSARLMKTFGFKGVNFGNWMKGAGKATERQLHLNHAYDAFHDLAEVMGVPADAMSLGGMMGIAFGAQGSGKYAAHFVPGVNEINLTRTSGAGSLAHEWAHGLDHYFARQAGLERDENPFLTEHAAMKEPGGTLRPEVLDRMRAIVETMNRREMTPDELAARREEQVTQTTERLDRWIAAMRTEFLLGIPAGQTAMADGKSMPYADAFDALAGKLRDLDVGGPSDIKFTGRRGASKMTLSPGVLALRALYKAGKKGRGAYRLDNLQQVQANLDYLIYVRDSVQQESKHIPQRPTDYARGSATLDAGKGGEAYWGTDREMFARAYNAYVEDSLAARSARNTYLATGTAGTVEGYAPAGDERTEINRAFDDLVATLETRETPMGTEIYRDVDEARAGTADANELRALGRKLFGDDWVIVRDQVLTPAGREAMGRYADGLAEISTGKGNPDSSVLHEAVHRAEDQFLTPEELTELRTAMPDAETRAEGIVRYANEGKGIAGKVVRVVRRLLRRIRAFVGASGQLDALHDLYDKVMGGKFAGAEVLGTDTSTRSLSRATAATRAQDAAYMKAVESGDMETAQKMVDKAASLSGLPILQDDSVTAWKIRRKPAPKQTQKAYKLMVAKPRTPGEVFPLFVGATDPVPLGVWLDATAGKEAPPSKTGRRKVKSSLGPLAYRPGWHLGDSPVATHIGRKDKAGNIYARKANEVWVEADVAADIDYQPEANKNGTRQDGEFSDSLADIKHMPTDGMYRYKTNRAMRGNWIITGSMRLNRVLTEAETNRMLEDRGIAPMPWEGGALDLAEMGLQAGAQENVAKMLDSVTRDDQGNVIPLSQRFDPSTDDIRYRTGPEQETKDPHTYRTEAWGDAVSGAWDWAGSFFGRQTQADTNARTDISKLQRNLSTISHFSDKVPGLKLVFESALRLRDNIHLFAAEIFGRNENEMAALRRHAKRNKVKWAKMEDYLHTRDENAIGGRVEPSGSGFQALQPGEESGTGPVFATEDLAWREVHRLEAEWLRGSKGWNDGDARALYSVRGMMDAAYRQLMAEATRHAQERARLGLPPATLEDGTDLMTALREMGQHRAYFLPRMRGNGRFVLLAKRRGSPDIRRHFDTRGARERAMKGYKQDGYAVELQLNENASGADFGDMSVLALNDFIGGAVANLKKQGKTTLKAWGLEAGRVTYTKADGSTERHLTVADPGRASWRAILEDFGGRPYDDNQNDQGRMWHFANPAQGLGGKLAEALSQHEYGAANMADAFGQMLSQQVADMIHSGSSRSTMIGRSEAVGEEVVQGFETDVLKAVAMYGKSVASGTAKRQAAREMLQAITGTTVSWQDFLADYARTHGDIMEGIDPKEAAATMRKDAWEAYQKVVRAAKIDPATQPVAFKEATEYMRDILRAETGAERAFATFKGIACMKYLSGIAPGVVNMTALLTTMPASMKMYADIPLLKAGRLLTTGVKDYTAYYLHQQFGTGSAPTGEDAWVLNQINNRGWDDPIMGMEAIGALQHQSQQWLGSLIDTSMIVFSVTERINRGSSILATYRGLIDQGVEREAALTQAKKATDKGHGVYGKENLPALVRGPGIGPQVGRAFYMYKTFSHNYLLVLGEMIHKRDIAAAGYMLLSPAVLAGTGATVATPLLSILAKAVGAVFGMPMDDPEEEWYRWVDEAFGGRAERLARTGLAGLLGVNLKGSLSIGITDLPTSIKDVLGAPYSLGEDAYKGMESIARGDVYKGVEKLSPRVLSSLLRGGREFTEGVTTRNNQPMYYGSERLTANWYEALLRGLSFNPAGLSAKRERQWKDYQVEADYRERRTDIYARIRRHDLTDGSGAAWMDILGDIERYNARVRRSRFPGVGFITESAIKTQLKRMGKAHLRERRRDGTAVREDPGTIRLESP